MRFLVGVLTFVGVALLVAAARWPDDPSFAREAPMDAIAFSLLLTPFISTWMMPTRRSLLLFPAAAFGLWYLSGVLGFLIPEPPMEEQRYMCGLPMFAMMVLGLLGLITGVAGRALGLSVIGKMSAAKVYLVQLIPFGGLVTFFALITPQYPSQ